MEQQQAQPTQAKVDIKPERNKLVLILVTLVFAFAGAAGYLGYLLSTENDQPAAQNTNKVAQDDAASQEALSEPVGIELVSYENEEYGFSFDYPKEWGSVDGLSNDASFEGKSYTGTFTEKSAVEFSATSKDFDPGGRDGGCAVASFVKVYPGRSLSDYVREEGENTYTQQGEKETQYSVLTKLLEKTEAYVIQESFEAGRVEGPGSCLGYFSNAFIIDNSLSKIAGMSFSLSTPLNNAGEVYDTGLIEDYKEDADFYIDPTLKNDFIKLVKSVKSL